MGTIQTIVKLKISKRLASIGVFFLFACFTFIPFMEVHALNLSVNDPKYFWMDEEIEKQFSYYEKTGITLEMVNRTEKATAQGWEWQRFKVVNSRAFGPSGAVKEMLDYLVKYYDVPDVDFVYLKGDGIIDVGNIKLDENFPGPGLVSAKRKDSKNMICFHEWYYYIKEDSHVPHYNWAIVYKQMPQISSKISWDQKISKAFWRGNRTGPWHWTLSNWKQLYRTKICWLSYMKPDILDAGLAGKDPVLAFIWDHERIDIFKGYTSLEDHLKFKYQICLDGHTSTYPGYQWRLYSKCCTLKQETENIQWFYTALQPWVHYIPIREDLEDLYEKIEWAILNDEEAKAISENAYKFVEENLMPEHIALYCYKVLRKYASLQTFDPGHRTGRNR